MKKKINQLDHSSDKVELLTEAAINDTGNYTVDIDLTQRAGILISTTYDASGATDNLIMQLFKSPTSTWVGTENKIDEVEIPSDGSADIEPYTLDASMYGPGHYRALFKSSGANDTFNVDSDGYFWDSYEGY